ncbi:phosphoesterase, putative [Cordyceps militaris CM01]|uniref:Phosphoesterase, putative n=1 Tax=Cordyceps militaris (strain CM01) TaxID=983644 RepID=G3JBI7_CORMM|nr:phosphoesterase, putative [Cordyceps militaris CM01]EGX95292.1 phosphoesterase, putative [Cordyceps militaris CM01]
MATTISGPLPTWRPPQQTSWQRFRKNPALFVAQHLYRHRALPRRPPDPESPLTVVCISDTHNTQPAVPSGDILVHAGDLSVGGTFAELQAQLAWLNTLPHRYKVVIAGNHDLLLDPAFVARSPDRICEEEGAARSNLYWGDVVYLNNTSERLRFPGRKAVHVVGSPWTPSFGNWAFQYPDVRDVWDGMVSEDVDVLLTHGPPRGHLDDGGKGCPQLTQEILRVRPKLVVFGHIHVGHGEERVSYDGFERAYGEIMGGNDTLLSAMWMLFWFCISRVGSMFGWHATARTTMVNAAVVGASMDHAEHDGIVVKI